MSLRTLLGGVAFACVAGRAEAADSSLKLSIPARSYGDALIELGVQANVSVLGTANCGADGHATLSGRYSLDEALKRLLAGAPCTYRIVDARTVRIVPILPAPGEARHEASRVTNLVAELVVTATKRPATLDNLAASVSALPHDQLATSGAVEVGQTVGQLAGVISTNLGPGRDKLLIRGLSDGAFTGRTRSTVSTYLDHAPINYNAPDPDLRLVDVDRVEVARGPQGALYGSGAISGIYRIVTRKPDLERAEFGGMAGYAATRGGDPSHEYEAYANLPLIKDRLAVRITGYDDVQGGYLDDVNLQIANVDQTQRQGGRVAVRLRLNDNWRFDALAATQDLKSDDSQYVTATLPPAGPDVPREIAESAFTSPIGAPDQRANQVREGHRNNFDYAGAQLQGDFDWGSISSSVSYVHHVFSSLYDATAVKDKATGAFPDVQADLGVYTEATRSDILAEDVVIRSPAGVRLDWLVGAYGVHTNEHNPSTLGLLSAGPTGAPTVSTAYAETRKDRVTERAVYGETTYHFSDGWSATLGGRLFWTRVRTSADIFVIAPYGPRAFEGAKTFTGFSPKVSLQRTFSNGDLVYGLITEGYRPGGFNSSGFFAIKSARSTFSSDRLRNYEVGLKLRRFDGRLAVRAAAYYDDWHNIQTDQYRLSGLAYTANVGDARIIGLEAEVEAQLATGLSLQLNGLISDSKIRNPNPDFTPLVAGALPGVPKASGGLLAVYQRPLAGDFNLRLVAEISYVGSAGLSFSAPRTMDPYWRTDFSAEVATTHWRLMAYITNPFNDSGDTFAYGNPFSFGQVRQVTPQRPRTVGVRLGAAF